MAPIKRVTVRDIAAKAGVSISTVSRALRNDPQQTAAMCRRIQELAKRMDYRPDPLIAAWISRRWAKAGREQETIAWITAYPGRDAWKSYPYLVELKRGADARAKQRGYRLEHFWLNAPGMNEDRLSGILTSRGIRGVCVAPFPESRKLALRWDDFAGASIGYSLLEPHLHRACSDHLQGIALVLRRLRDAGCRHIGLCLDRRVSQKVNYNWEAGALLFRRQNPRCRLSLLMVDKSRSKAAFKKWVGRNRPEVIVGSDDFVAKWAGELKLDTPMATLAREKAPTCAGLDQRSFDVGMAAVDLIIGQLQRNESGIPVVPRIVLVEGVWRDASSLTPMFLKPQRVAHLVDDQA